MSDYPIDPELDLVLEREVEATPEQIWKAWTTPEHLVGWWAPRPWTTKECEIDLRPGGKFVTTMVSPEGDEYPGASCYLEVVENRRLVFTSSLGPGYRPNPEVDLAFTAVITLEPTATGTRYRAIAIHGSRETAKAHADMGFHEGWGMTLNQLVDLARDL